MNWGRRVCKRGCLFGSENNLWVSGRHRAAAKLLSHETRRIALNIAKLPDLLRR
jgi:hypothetical protein